MAGASPIELVVFDLGGVVVRVTRSWAEAHERAGLPHPRRGLPPRFDAEIEPLAQQLERGALGLDAFYERYAAASGGVYAAREVSAVLDAWIVDEYAGVAAVFDALDAAEVATAVLSNTNSRYWARAGQSATWRRAMHAHASHLLGALKPEPAIYERFEAATGARASAILFFDDGESNVEAARARGWRAEHIDHAGDTATQLLDALRAHGVIR